jgi:hypothetical protein
VRTAGTVDLKQLREVEKMKNREKERNEKEIKGKR